MAIGSVGSSPDVVRISEPEVVEVAPPPPPKPPETKKEEADQFVEERPSTPRPQLQPTLAAPASVGTTFKLSDLIRNEAAVAKDPTRDLVLKTSVASAGSAEAVAAPGFQTTQAEADFKVNQAAVASDPETHLRAIDGHPYSHEYQARYIQLLQESGQLGIEADKAMVPGPTGTPTVTNLRYGAEFVEALDAARSQGKIGIGEIHNLSERYDGMYLAAKKMHPPVATGATSPSVNDTNRVNEATGAYEKARSRVEALNYELSTALATLNPGLTEQQRLDYTTRFKELHRPDYDAEISTAKKLADTLEAVDPRRQGVSAAIAKGYEALAKSPLADRAANWIETLKGPGGAQLRADYAAAMGVGVKAFEAQLDAVRDKAIATMMTQSFTECPGDPVTAREKFFTRLDGYKNIKENLGGGVDFLESAFKALGAFNAGEGYGQIAELAKEFPAVGAFGAAASFAASPRIVPSAGALAAPPLRLDAST